MSDQISSDATNRKARSPWAYGVAGTLLGLLAGGLICAWVINSTTSQTKATAGERAAAIKDRVGSDSSQPMCCYLDVSKAATAANAEGCFEKYTGEACKEWVRWKNLQAEEAYAEAVASFEYDRIRWPDLQAGEKRLSAATVNHPPRAEFGHRDGAGIRPRTRYHPLA